MVSLSEFKQAFAGSGTNDPVKERSEQILEALIRLKTAAVKAAGADGADHGLLAAVNLLFQRCGPAKEKLKAGDRQGAAVDLNELQRQIQIITARLEAAPVGAPALPAGAKAVPAGAPPRPVSSKPANTSPAPASTAQGLDVLVTITVVLDGYRVTDGLRSQAVGPIEVESPVGTHQLDNKRRVYVHVPANRTHQFTVRGSDPLFRTLVVPVDVGTLPVSREVRIYLGHRPKSNEPAVVPVAIRVVDDSSGAPLQNVSVHGPSGSGSSDKAGQVLLHVPMLAKHWIDVDPLEHERVSFEIDVEASAIFREVRVRKESLTLRLTVKVVDGRNKPIENASVDNNDERHRTDAAGRVTMPFYFGKSNQILKFQVAAHGYRTGELIVDSRVPDGSEVTARLVPVSKEELNVQWVYISVVEARGLGEVTVPGAKVTIGRETRLTREDGLVVFQLFPGRHEYTAMADGFVEARGQIDVYQMQRHGHGHDPEHIVLVPKPERD